MNGGLYEYSKWLHVVARSFKQTVPTAGEISAAKVVIKAFWDEDSKTGERPMNRSGLWQKEADYETPGVEGENNYILAKMLQTVAKNIKKAEMSVAEETACDVFMNNAEIKARYISKIGGTVGPDFPYV